MPQFFLKTIYSISPAARDGFSLGLCTTLLRCMYKLGVWSTAGLYPNKEQKELPACLLCQAGEQLSSPVFVRCS